MILFMAGPIERRAARQRRVRHHRSAVIRNKLGLNRNSWGFYHGRPDLQRSAALNNPTLLNDSRNQMKIQQLLARLTSRKNDALNDARNAYIQLAKEVILNSVYEPGPHLDEGQQWPPGHALTMIGRKRLDNVHELVLRVLQDRIPGDLIETGVWRGGATILMRAILKSYGVRDRRVFAADSFCGIPPVNPEKYPADRVHAGSHEMEILTNNSLERVQENFARLHLLDDQVVFLKGWFKDTLPQISTKRIALMRLDGDIYESTWDALTNLYPRLSLGGYVIIDDMCWEGCVTAVDDYRRMYGISAPIHKVDWTGIYWRKTAEIARRAA